MNTTITSVPFKIDWSEIEYNQFLKKAYEYYKDQRDNNAVIKEILHDSWESILLEDYIDWKNV